LACTWIQFVHLICTVLSDELVVSCDDWVAPMALVIT
jgi:hypothetical protein